MNKVKSNEISMKPRWHFILGSLLTMVGLISFSAGAIFMTNITLFLLRRHGPMKQWRLEQMISSFPVWIPVVAIVGISLGIWILNKYDFSYKKNMGLIIGGFIVSIIVAAFLLDHLGVNDNWSRQGPMRRFYQQIQYQNDPPSKGRRL